MKKETIKITGPSGKSIVINKSDEKLYLSKGFGGKKIEKPKEKVQISKKDFKKGK